MLIVLWKQILSRSQAQYLEKYVPTEYSNLRIDNEGFIYTVIQANDMNEAFNAVRSRNDSVMAVRRLNSFGDDILKRKGEVPILGDLNFQIDDETRADYGPSAFVDICVDSYGTYYCLDARRCKIFAYDRDGNLLYVFGGEGLQLGTFRQPAAIDIISNKLAVLDRANNTVTLFAPTGYGAAIIRAREAYSKGYYEESLSNWYEVLQYNVNFKLALSGAGKCLYYMGDYNEAFRYLRMAGEKEFSAKVFEAQRKEWVQKNFSVVLILLVVALTAALFPSLFHIRRKAKAGGRQSSVINKGYAMRFSRLRLGSYCMVRPFKGFGDIKYEKAGSVATATLFFALYGLVKLFNAQYTGYFYSTYDSETFQPLSVLANALLPLFLWIIANWCLTTLMDGEGNMREIYMVTGYALVPCIIILFLLTLISNIMSPDDAIYYQTLMSVANIWMLSLMFIGSMVVHQYTLVKAVLTTVLSILGMLVMVFIALMFYSICQQVYSFFVSSFTELFYRM